MDIHKSIQDTTIALSLRGRFDYSVHRIFQAAIRSALADAAIHDIEIHLAGVDYIDSSALSMLLEFREHAKQLNRGVSLIGARGVVKKTLDIANFDRLFICK